MTPRPDPAAWGIVPGYHDVNGTWHPAHPHSVVAALRAMGADTPAPPGLGDDNPVWVVGHAEPVVVDGRWTVRTESGEEFTVDGTVPTLPLGYHDLTRERDGREVRLIVSPRRCFLPDDLSVAGWAVQLYALRSGSSWGIGDLGDLQRFGRWAADNGSGVVLLNPLHAALPALPQPASPYYPSSRCFRNVLHLDVSAAVGAVPPAAAASLNRVRRIDRDSVYELKIEALELAWPSRRTSDAAALDRYRAEQGAALDDYATFAVLAEVHGRPWTVWPADVRRPDGDGVAEFRAEFADRIRFHQWVQWLIDEQLGEAGAAVPLMHDVAVGVDPAGADAWMDQDSFCLDVRTGAPPDDFNAAGQDWGLPPFDPWRLRAARFEPFIRTIRAALAHAGSIRVDHVMGLFRLFWIPAGTDPADGVYVRYPSAEMLDIVALESVRAGAYVVGEDLGTVEDEVRKELAARGVLSYKLLWFEPDRPSSYPRQSMAAVTTHDLPTAAGLFSGSDIEAQRRAGVRPNVESTEQIIERVASWAGLDADTVEPAAAGAACHKLLSEAASQVIVATIEDALGVEERPNLPGTVDEYPNWSIALPVPLEDIVADDRMAATARLLGSGRGPSRDAAGGADAGQGGP